MKKYAKCFSLVLLFSQYLNGNSPLSMQAGTTKDHVIVHGKEFVLSIPCASIEKRNKELAQQIDADYTGKNPIIIGILTGATIFLSDLVKEMNTDCEIDFIKISTYGSSMKSSGNIKISKDLSLDITDRDVIILEDIVDSGLTIKYARDMILKKNPRSIRIATFLHKNLNSPDFPIDYVAFNIAPEFVIGYGLDYAQKARGLKDVYKLVE